MPGHIEGSVSNSEGRKVIAPLSAITEVVIAVGLFAVLMVGFWVGRRVERFTIKRKQRKAQVG